MHDPFYLDLDRTIQIQFHNARPGIRSYYEEEFPQRVHSGTAAAPLLQLEFQSLHPQDVRYIGARAVHHDENFFLLDGKDHVVQIDFAALQGEPPIVISADENVHVRFLHQVVEAVVKAIAPYHGHVFVHSSGFEINGKSVLIAAWAHTGKTNTLLSYLQAGANFYGDDWTILSKGMLIPYPKTLNLFGYNLREFPDIKRRLPLSFRTVFGATSASHTLLSPLTRGSSQLAHYATTLRDLVSSQGHVRLSLPELFPNARIASPQRPTLIILPERSDGPVHARDIDADTFVNRMIPCLRHERAKLSEWYAMYQFAFPGRTSKILEQLEETERAALRRQLDGIHIVAMDFGNGHVALEERKRLIDQLLV